MLAAGLNPGDEVITSALTFASTVNAIVHAGATPVLADVDPRTMNIDPIDVERRVGPRTRALLPVHFAGRSFDVDAIGSIAHRHGLRVVEDCAHAIETEHHGRKAGTLGDLGCFSFYVTKNVTTAEGHGSRRRREPGVAHQGPGAAGSQQGRVEAIQRRGLQHYYVTELGFKYNMTDLEAALGLHQLRRVESNWRRREQIWRWYGESLRELPIDLPAEPEPDTRHAYHLYTVLIDQARAGISRDDFLRPMTANGIGVGVHYLSIAEHPHYQQGFGWRPEQWPVAMTIGAAQ